MAFKSEAQRRKFGEMAKAGKIDKKTFNEWDKATGKEKLPERIGPAKPKSTDDLHKLGKRFGVKK